jgi:hypothetical protein
MDFEAQRLSNLEYKRKLLSDLDLQSSAVPVSATRPTGTKPPTKKRRIGVDVIPTRSSARISSTTRPSYREDNGPRYNEVEAEAKTLKRRPKAEQSQKATPEPAAVVTDEYVADVVAGWTAWLPSAPPPTRSDSDNVFHFEDQPTFTPNKSPSEVMQEGCFGGSYFRPLRSTKLGLVVEDDWKELPQDWIQGLDPAIYLISSDYDPSINKYKVACGQSIEEWEAAGWIAHEYDVRGWFQWYCRFFQGRRCDDDERQISRWRKCVGETGRWRRMLLKKYMAMGVRYVFDDGEEEDTKEVSPVMHQTCHHWAYEVRQDDLDRAWNGLK